MKTDETLVSAQMSSPIPDEKKCQSADDITYFCLGIIFQTETPDYRCDA